MAIPCGSTQNTRKISKKIQDSSDEKEKITASHSGTRYDSMTAMNIQVNENSNEAGTPPP